MLPKPSSLSACILVLVAIPSTALAQEETDNPVARRGRRDPFAIPMHPKPIVVADPEPIRSPDPVPAPAVEKPPAPSGEDRAAVLRRFAARGVRVQGIIHEVVPTIEPVAAGVNLLGHTIRGEVFARVHLPLAHALVQIDAESRLVSAGDAVANDLRVVRVSRTEVVFRFHGAEVAVPVGASGA